MCELDAILQTWTLMYIMCFQLRQNSRSHWSLDAKDVVPCAEAHLAYFESSVIHLTSQPSTRCTVSFVPKTADHHWLVEPMTWAGPPPPYAKVITLCHAVWNNTVARSPDTSLLTLLTSRLSVLWGYRPTNSSFSVCEQKLWRVKPHFALLVLLLNPKVQMYQSAVITFELN